MSTYQKPTQHLHLYISRTVQLNLLRPILFLPPSLFLLQNLFPLAHVHFCNPSSNYQNLNLVTVLTSKLISLHHSGLCSVYHTTARPSSSHCSRPWNPLIVFSGFPVLLGVNTPVLNLPKKSRCTDLIWPVPASPISHHIAFPFDVHVESPGFFQFL